MTRFGSPVKFGSPPVVIQYASSAANGITTTMPMSCSTQRASRLGKRAGHCSNNPKASRAISPTSTARKIQMIVGVSEAMLSKSPSTVETISVNRTRRQPRIVARPRGLAEETADMA